MAGSRSQWLSARYDAISTVYRTPSTGKGSKFRIRLGVDGFGVEWHIGMVDVLEGVESERSRNNVQPCISITTPLSLGIKIRSSEFAASSRGREG